MFGHVLLHNLGEAIVKSRVSLIFICVIFSVGYKITTRNIAIRVIIIFVTVSMCVL